MKTFFTHLVVAGALLCASGCASIVSKSSYPVMINSSPSEAAISITNKRGMEVYRGSTPAVVKLRAGGGYFTKALYLVRFDLPGYDTRVVPIEYTLDGWYFGNILFGGFLGLLIIDPATGAMFKLDSEYINETLTQSTSAVSKQELKVYTLAEIPAKWEKYLVKIAK